MKREHNTQISIVSMTVNKTGVKTNVKNIDVIEHNKCYDVLGSAGKTKKRYVKERMNKPSSNLTNVIGNSTPTIGYHMVTTPDRIDWAKDELRLTIDTRVSELQEGINGLIHKLK